MVLSFEITKHAKRRLAQRGLKLVDIEKVYHYGEVIFKQGLSFYFLKKRTIRNMSLSDKLEGVVVIVDEAVNEIITAYKNKRAFKHIRKKNCYLIK
jgi:hypothetical protein